MQKLAADMSFCIAPLETGTERLYLSLQVCIDSRALAADHYVSEECCISATIDVKTLHEIYLPLQEDDDVLHSLDD